MIELIAAETHEHGHGFFAEYWEILSNPAHLSVEITLMFLIDVLLLGLLWPLVRRFIDAGYTLSSVDAFDLFPNTPHVETVVRLERNPP